MIWDDRSITIATYALCGFANFGTIGIEIATLSVLFLIILFFSNF
jgi:nucleoside permease NupC